MKTLIPVLATLFTFQLYAQVIFSEDFDGIAGPTAGGAGTYIFPAGWLLRNVDNKTPDASVAYVNDSWERREDFNFNVADSAMFSTSYYSPVGAADDWAWTPSMTLTSNAQLSWNAVTYDPSYQDGYEVRIMTASSTPGGPTGGTGLIGNQVTNSTVLFSTPAENSSWTNRTVDLSPYAGETVWIAFRNTSNDKFLLLIDDVIVQQLLQHDAALTGIGSEEYSTAPLGISPTFPLQATILSAGSNSITGLTLTADVYDSNNNLVHTESSTPSTLASGSSSTVTLSDFVPATIDTFTVYFHATINEADGNSTNDTLINHLVVSDSVYARDLGAVTGTLGIGAGNGGYLGQQFTVNSDDTLTSVTMYCTHGYTGKPCAAVIWDISAGLPNQVVAATDTILYPDDSARVYTIPVQGLAILAAGEYVITAIEFDSTLALGLTNDIFTAGTTWINWPTNPTGNWAHNEDFGVQFAKTYIIRGNFGTICQNIYTTVDTTICSGDTYTVGSHIYSATGIYQDTFPSGIYCNNFVTTNLNVLPINNTLVDTTICFGETYTVGSNIYAASGVYQDTFPSGNCYSLVTSNLTVLAPIPTSVSVSSDKTTFTANVIAGASYQWIDCATNTPITGATDSTYTTSAIENIAVVISSNGCSDTSNCITNDGLGIDENTVHNLKVMPNPAQNTITIDGSGLDQVVVLNADGRKVMTITLTPGTQQSVDVSKLSRGVYYLTSPIGGAGIRFVLQ